MKIVKLLRENLLLGISYVVLSLIIGETHPFTMVPLYNNFPNYAYAYYLSDAHGELLPIEQYFKYDADKLAHNFVAICESKNMPNGFQMETEEQLREVGKEMMTQLMKHRFAPIPAETLQLHRTCYFMQADTIAQNDIVIYETAVQP